VAFGGDEWDVPFVVAIVVAIVAYVVDNWDL
jgi:hypothetical protein